jgi:hypothetical protein
MAYEVVKFLSKGPFQFGEYPHAIEAHLHRLKRATGVAVAQRAVAAIKFFSIKKT